MPLTMNNLKSRKYTDRKSMGLRHHGNASHNNTITLMPAHAETLSQWRNRSAPVCMVMEGKWRGIDHSDGKDSTVLSSVKMCTGGWREWSGS